MRLLLALVFGGFVGLGISAEIERIHAFAAAEKEAAFLFSMEGRAYSDCLMRPILNTAGAALTLCDPAEWRRLGALREKRTTVSSLDILGHLL